MSADDMKFGVQLLALLGGSGVFGMAVGFVISRMGGDDDGAPPAVDTSDAVHWSDAS